MIKTFGEGRFVNDPVLRTAGGTDVVNFTLAVNEYRRSGTERVRTTHYFDFEAWDSGARTIAEYCKKGSRLFFEAKPRQQKWEDKESGQKRSRVIFRIDEFSLVSDRGRGDESPSTQSETKEVNREVPDDEVPF